MFTFFKNMVEYSVPKGDVYMSFDKIIQILKEESLKKAGNGLEYDDYMKLLNNNEVKALLDEKYKGVKEVNKKAIVCKNNFLRNLLEIYFIDNDIDIVDNEELDASCVNVLNIYQQEIGKYKVLSREEEVELFTEYNKTKDPLIKEKIAKHNLRLVFSIAKRHNWHSEEKLKDAIQDGSEGLLLAIDKFDVTMGNKFSTFAHWWINQAIMRSEINNNRAIRLPVHFVERLNRMNVIIGKYVVEHGEEPTDEYLAEKLNISIEKIREIKRDSQEVVSCDKAVGEDDHGEETTLGDFIENKTFDYNSEKKALYNSLRVELRKALDEKLTERQKEVLYKRYGLEDGVPRTLEDVASDYGLTRERIRQIEDKALRKVRVGRKDLIDYLR